MDKKGGIARTGGNGRRSACVAHGGVVYLSGITTVDIEAGVDGQARDILSQIDKLLAANHSDKRRVLYANIILQSMNDYGAFNAVWDEWVADGFEPARSVVEGALSLPEYKIKIALVAAQAL